MEKNNCRKCKHLYRDGEGWELPQFDYWNCKKFPHLANLWSFPFKQTKCEGFERKEN